MHSIASIVSEAKEYTRSMPTQDAFLNYRGVISPVLGRYSGIPSPNVELLHSRYQTELACLHVIREIVTQWSRQSGRSVDVIDEYGYPELYPYRLLPRSLRRKMAQWVSSVDLTTAVAPLFKEIAEIVLNQGEKRPLGEFYTPFHIARHLVSSLNLNLPDIARGQRIMDPACGSGTLLAIAAHDLVEAALLGKVDAARTLSQLDAIFYGFDVQPFAILLARWQLLFTSLTLLMRIPQASTPTFPNIQLHDALSDPPNSLWWKSKESDYIVTNPPFARIPLGKVPAHLYYQDVLYGHPNLYQLFLWWSVQAVRPGGKVAILVPQSFRAGLYFQELRRQLDKNCRLTSITQFTDREGVIDDVDTLLMAVTMQKRDNKRTNADSCVTIRVSSNGHRLDETVPISIPQQRVLRSHLQSPVWLISDCLADYDIIERVYAKSIPFGKIRAIFSAHNGGFVWNQHKPLLRADCDIGTIPLLSTHNIGLLHFEFPAAYLVREARQFSILSPKVADLRSGICLLVKRTTPRKRGRRVIASLVPNDFAEQRATYFVENHLNLVNLEEGQVAALLVGLAGWLNSRLLNFIFQMMNGNSHISVHEMELFPVPVDFLSLIAPVVIRLEQTPAGNRRALWEYLDRKIYAYYDLSESELNRVNTLIPVPGD